MTEWIKYFTEDSKKYHSILEHAVNHWIYNEPLHFRIKNLISPPAKILDIGCGLGLSTIYLSECGYDTLGIDNNADIISQAKKNAEHFNSKAKFEISDSFDLSKYHNLFDLTYSVGVIEHFPREKTISLIKEQSKCSKYTIAVIPTKFSKYSGTSTDERIYNISQLCEMIRESGLETVGKFGYGNVFSPFHNQIHRILPHGLYRILQNYFSYSMGIACIGRRMPCKKNH